MIAAVHLAAVAMAKQHHASVAAHGLAKGGAWAVFFMGAVLILAGALGVVLLRNPVHCALMLVVTLFGVAVEFVDQSADFLAAVQIIVYAGAVVIVFLFVIMLLGVDRREAVAKEPVKMQKPLAGVVALAMIVEILVLTRVHDWTSGAHSLTGVLTNRNPQASAGGPTGSDVRLLGQVIYTHYLLPFEMTAALLVIAVVAAVVLARRRVGTEALSADHKIDAEGVEDQPAEAQPKQQPRQEVKS